MQEIKKRAIVIASILKPLDDTRMFEKMGRTLELTGLWSVHIVGRGRPVPSPSIQFHSLGQFNRLSWRRFTSPYRVFRKLIQVKPNVVIINTHELLIAVSVYKIIFGCRAIYDVCENYYLNLLHTDAFPHGIRYLLALGIRFKEWLTGPWIDHFMLAETSYKNELKFIGDRFTVIENKSVVPGSFKRTPTPDTIRLLFTGTIDKSTGIEEAIALSELLHQAEPRVELRIVGHCARPGYRERLLEKISRLSFISTDGLERLVSHSLIWEEIGLATAGLIFYPPSFHNENRIPTKVYEYLAGELPIIYDRTARWKALVSPQEAIETDFRDPVPREILQALSRDRFFPKSVAIAHWETESPKFLGAVDAKNA